MAKRRVTDVVEQSVLVLFDTEEELDAGARVLKGIATARIVRLETTMKALPRHDIAQIRHLRGLRAWLRSSRGRHQRVTYYLASTKEFELRDKTMSALAAMRVPLPHVLLAGQDQIFLLDRDQRMVGFFGHWPTEAPFHLEELVGKRKRDVFGPEVAAVHEAAGLEALNGRSVTYEWAVTKASSPTHLFTAASPLRNENGEIAGVLLVTRNITALKQAQFEIEQALQEKTNQLSEVERKVRQLAATFLSASRERAEQTTTSGLDVTAVLSKREQQILTLLGGGARLRSIAQTLGISVETARRHVKTMFHKTGVHSQEALVKLFFRGE